MQTWYDIVTPHEDIRQGDFDESVFAADLGNVVSGTAPVDYQDPYTFFKKTYLTDGLEKLLQQVHRKLASGKGPSVVELQTPFGGGKTHSLVAIYHYLANGDEISSLLPEGVELIDPSIFTLVGTQASPSSGFGSDGVSRKTIWGELAYQLGGQEAYDVVAADDGDRVSPGKNTLRKLLKEHQPFILLFDEVLEYVVKARGVKVVDSTLGGQTLSFFQELTEVVSNLPRGLMIATLPSSELEDFGEVEQGNLDQLEKIFGRLEAIETPVRGEEIYSIIRRRLFEPVQDEQGLHDTVDRYISKYKQHEEELPAKVKGVDFREKMKLSYPFHPDVIDILYEKWSTFASFQRTRGVLRLLANVVEDLYQREAALDLIVPGDINLEYDPTRREFLKHIGDQYEGIIGSDIAGSDAKSQSLDDRNKDWNHLAERNATAVFMHSFTADDAEKGTTKPYIKLAVLHDDTIPPLVTEVLEEQEKELWYLNKKPSGEYYFSNVPNLNRMIVDRKEIVDDRDVRRELKHRLESNLGNKFDCYLWPNESNDVPDNRSLKLVVFDPETSYSQALMLEWLKKRRANNPRTYKNTVYFAIPEASRYGRLQDDIRKYLALKEIKDELKDDDRPGMLDRRKEVERRVRDLKGGFAHKIRNLYRTVAVPSSDPDGVTIDDIDLGQPTVGKENLDTWYWKQLTDETRETILVKPPSSRLIQAKFLNSVDELSLSALRDQFYKEPALPVLGDDSILAEGVAGGVREGAFALVRKTTDGDYDLDAFEYEKALAPTTIEFDDQTYLVSEEVASGLQARVEPVSDGGAPEGKETPEVDETSSQKGSERKWGTDAGGGKPDTGSDDEESSEETTVPEYHLRASGIAASRISDVHSGILMPLKREVGDFDITLEIHVESEDGIDKDVVEKQVEETLRQLGADVETD